MNLICPVCENGKLSKSTYKSEYFGIELECYLCDTCGAQPISDAQIKRNHDKYEQARQES